MTTEEQENEQFDPGEFFEGETQEDETNELENAVVKNEQIPVKSASEKEEPEPEKKEPDSKPEEETAKTDKDTETKEVSEDDIKAVLDSTEEESEQEQESVFDSILPKPKEEAVSERQQEDTKPERSKFVPLSEVVKQRNLKQQAIKERDKLLAAEKERQEREKSEMSPLKKFVEENPDEDIIPAKVQLEQQEWLDSRRSREIEAQRKVEEANHTVTKAQKEEAESYTTYVNNAKALEKEFRKEHKDYDAVTKPVLNVSPLTHQEQKQLIDSKNPAETLYNICKKKAEAIRSLFPGDNTNKSTTEKNTTEKPKEKSKGDKKAENKSAKSEDEELNDEDIKQITDEESFEAFMGETDK